MVCPSTMNATTLTLIPSTITSISVRSRIDPRKYAQSNPTVTATTLVITSVGTVMMTVGTTAWLSLVPTSSDSYFHERYGRAGDPKSKVAMRPTNSTYWTTNGLFMPIDSRLSSMVSGVTFLPKYAATGS